MSWRIASPVSAGNGGPWFHAGRCAAASRWPVSQRATFRQVSELLGLLSASKRLGEEIQGAVVGTASPLHRRRQAAPAGQISQCVPIWYLGHFLMCPIAISCANWRARRPASCTSRIRGCRTRRTKFWAVFIQRIPVRPPRRRPRHRNLSRGVGLLNRTRCFCCIELGKGSRLFRCKVAFLS